MHPEIKPALFIWACKRSGKSFESLLKKFPKLSMWMEGNEKPTLKQLESFAKSTYTPVGYFFLEKPPAEKLPLPDFRTIGNEYVSNPSPHLLDTIYLCQQRQEWYRDYLKMNGMKPLGFPGSIQTTDSVVQTALKIRETLGFDIEKRKKIPTWEASLSHFIELVEKSGGGDFYANQKYKVSSNFARALLISTLEGHTLHRDAFKLLGFSKLSKFKHFLNIR